MENEQIQSWKVPLSKESSYELQLLDCNCNECAYMERDFIEFQKWSDFHEKIQMQEFRQRRELAITEAVMQWNDWLVRKAYKMKFFFDTSILIGYGNCNKFNKPVSFIPSIMQIETQNCFIHRKNFKNE